MNRIRKLIKNFFSGYILSQSPKSKKRIMRCMVISLFVFVTLTIFVFATASSNHIMGGSALITVENRHLIGQETNNEVSSEIIQEHNVFNSKTSNLIRSSDENIPSPAAIENFTTEKHSDNYITPEIITLNGSISIFTKADGTGWNLEKGKTLSFNFEKYESKAVENQLAIIGCIKDGKLMKGQQFDKLSGVYTVTVDEKGEFYIYVLNASSDSISFKKGTIKSK